MSSRSVRRKAVADGRRSVKAELTVHTGNDKVELEVLKFGLHVALDQADVVQAVFFEDSKKLEIGLKEGSKVTLSCTFEGAQQLAVNLLPEERDSDFLVHTVDGDRFCAWDDLR
ncbi:hypothetical protein [Cupriavidus sp. CuC1]|uniref:hypothetical protein n=1 Tax=Cupriavidus sp. CuC1 TaxID=3373131 RepID=UPI0037D2B438